MLHGVRHDRCEVILLPAPKPKFSGHKTRVAISQNPDWYRWAVSYYGQSRIKRTRMVDYLTRIVDGAELHHSAKVIINEIANGLVLDHEFNDPYEGLEIDGERSSDFEPTNEKDKNEPPF